MVTGVVNANPGVVLACLWETGAEQQLLYMWVDVTGVKGLLQKLCDIFEVFT
jgi:hypothetical protein